MGRVNVLARSGDHDNSTRSFALDRLLILSVRDIEVIDGFPDSSLSNDV